MNKDMYCKYGYLWEYAKEKKEYKKRDNVKKGLKKSTNQGKHDIHLGMKDQLSEPLCVLDNNLAKKEKFEF